MVASVVELISACSQQGMQGRSSVPQAAGPGCTQGLYIVLCGSVPPAVLGHSPGDCEVWAVQALLRVVPGENHPKLN